MITYKHDTGLRQALRKIANGFHILTSRKRKEELTTLDQDYIAAGTVTWICQVSFNPPMVLVAVKNGTDLQETIEKSGVFVVNNLSKEEEYMLPYFFRDSEVRDGKINGFEYGEEVTGAPVFKGISSYFECEVREFISPGDHTLFIGEVVNEVVHDKTTNPLYEHDTGYIYGG